MKKPRDFKGKKKYQHAQVYGKFGDLPRVVTIWQFEEANAKDCRRLAKWLNNAAKWLEVK